MAEAIEIRTVGDIRVGSVMFDESPQRLHAERTADGFRLQIPIKISFKMVPRGEPMPLLGNFHGIIYAGEDQGSKMQIGEMRLESWHKGGFYDKPEHGGEYSQNDYMIWSGSLAQLAVYEKIRDGRQPKFEIRFTGELCFLLPTEHEYYYARSEPDQFFSRSGNLRVSYPKEAWVEMLRGLGVAENVLVEIPLPQSPPAPWDEVWANLVSARNHFEHGGSTGWSSCILAVRQALEKWRDIEQPNTGSGDPKNRSKRERLNNLRQALHQCTHIWIHRDDEATRDDALLMLSTLLALLAERKP
jgi:hypothetical protein